jgi:hypothetical protein
MPKLWGYGEWKVILVMNRLATDRSHRVPQHIRMQRELMHVNTTATDIMASDYLAYRIIEHDEARLTVSSSILNV